MSLAEVVFRAWRFIYGKYEKRRIMGGWEPMPCTMPSSAEPLFSVGLVELLDEWYKRFGAFDKDSYEALLSKANLFAHFDVDISKTIDWHRDPETGIVAPLIYGKDIDYRDNDQVGNCKTLWELARHKHLVPLAVAYVVSGEAKYVEKISEHIDGWIEQNPFGLGAHWCSSLEVSLRLIAWSFVHALVMLRDKDGLFGKLKKQSDFAISIYQHAYFISHYLSRHSSANNHLIGELTGLWVGCKVFDMGDDGALWAQLAKRELSKEAGKQVFSDGVSKEQATYYHLWVCEYLLLAWLIASRYGDAFDDSFSERISKMTQFLIDLRPIDGEVPQIGDSDDGLVVGFDPANSVSPYEEVFATVSQLGGWGADSSSSSSYKAFWYTAILGSTKDKTFPLPRIVKQSDPVKVYPDGGYVVLGDGISHVVFDAGSLGYPSIAAHGHADALSVYMAFKGDWWLVDPGTYCYHTEPDWRDYFRGTGAHNTMSISSKDQSLIGGAFLWLKHAKVSFGGVIQMENGDVQVSGSVTGYSVDGGKHKRMLWCRPAESRVDIHDSIENCNSGTFEVRFHFHPDVAITQLKNDTYRVQHAKHDGEITIMTDPGLKWRIANSELNPHLGWYSETLGSKVPCNVLVGRGECGRCSSSVVRIDWSDLAKNDSQ